MKNEKKKNYRNHERITYKVIQSIEKIKEKEKIYISTSGPHGKLRDCSSISARERERDRTTSEREREERDIGREFREIYAPRRQIYRANLPVSVTAAALDLLRVNRLCNNSRACACIYIYIHIYRALLLVCKRINAWKKKSKSRGKSACRNPILLYIIIYYIYKRARPHDLQQYVYTSAQYCRRNEFA